MLDSILALVKNEVSKVVSNSPEIPAEKKAVAEKELTHSLAAGLQENFTPSNLSSLTDMFSGVGGGDIMGKLENTALSTLTKLGLSSGAAKGIVAALIPAIIGAFSKKVNDPNSGFDVQSMIGAVSGEHGGGFMDKLKKMFS